MLLATMALNLTPRKCSWPTPTGWCGVLPFLELTNFFIKYIQGADPSANLTDLSKKDVDFRWTLSCKAALHALRYALTNAPLLAIANPDKCFKLVCDASGFGLGCYPATRGVPTWVLF